MYLFPAVVWERNLCQFYSQISAWVTTVEQECGLSLAVAPPTRNQTLSAAEQWEVARSYWNTVLDSWKASVQDVLGDDILSSSAASGGTSDQSQAAWVQAMSSWQQNYEAWSLYVRDNGEESSGFPTSSNSSDIVMRLEGSEVAGSVVSNSEQWSSLVGDWREAFTTFNTSYEERCG